MNLLWNKLLPLWDNDMAAASSSSRICWLWISHFAFSKRNNISLSIHISLPPLCGGSQLTRNSLKTGKFHLNCDDFLVISWVNAIQSIYFHGYSSSAFLSRSFESISFSNRTELREAELIYYDCIQQPIDCKANLLWIGNFILFFLLSMTNIFSSCR